MIPSQAQKKIEADRFVRIDKPISPRLGNALSAGKRSMHPNYSISGDSIGLAI